MWNTNTGQRLQTLGSDDHVADAPLSWSQDSKKVILGVGTILQIRDGTTGTLRQRFDTRQEIKMLAVSPTVPLVAVTDGSTSIQVWNLDTEQLVQTLIGFTAEIANPDRNMKWSPDGTHLAVLSLSGSHSTSRSLVLWDANTWKSTSTFPADCFSWSPDSKTLAIGLDTSAYTVDSKTGSIITK